MQGRPTFAIGHGCECLCFTIILVMQQGSISGTLDTILAGSFEDYAWFRDFFPRSNSHLRATSAGRLLDGHISLDKTIEKSSLESCFAGDG